MSGEDKKKIHHASGAEKRKRKAQMENNLAKMKKVTEFFLPREESADKEMEESEDLKVAISTDNEQDQNTELQEEEDRDQAGVSDLDDKPEDEDAQPQHQDESAASPVDTDKAKLYQIH